MAGWCLSLDRHISQVFSLLLCGFWPQQSSHCLPSSLHSWPCLLPLPSQPWTQYTQLRGSARRETEGAAWVPMAMASTCTPGLNPQNTHYIPGYTGHCPLLRFSMGQTYSQVTGQLLQGPPGLAWPPTHRTLLPPIRPPRSPELSRRSLPTRCRHRRLGSTMIPGYTGFVPQAQFIFAKNCSQVWAEALNDFTPWHGEQGSQELPQEAKGDKDKEPKSESELAVEGETELKLEVEQMKTKVLPYSMDDTDPQKFFMSAFLCSPTRHCRNLGRSTPRAMPSKTPNLSPYFPGPTFRTWVSYLTMGAMCQGISSSLATHLGISPTMLWA
ncbi:protein FAM166B isoform X2 [Fukomys damarensis]|uniref:protein FAM166B isoform X2 n=1 Tax=Fukomys damarensis TaxID=885580 RepID=UPI00053F3BC4|nr:protein FAM166B isoform X2 [Fukomys damarensis]